MKWYMNNMNRLGKKFLNLVLVLNNKYLTSVLRNFLGDNYTLEMKMLNYLEFTTSIQIIMLQNYIFANNDEVSIIYFIVSYCGM